MEALDPRHRLDSRAAAILADDQRHLFERTDRLFAALMLFEWAAAIAAALWISPHAWFGTQSDIQIHIWAAIRQSGAILLLSFVLVFAVPGRAITRHLVAAGLMLMSALLIDLTR